MTARDRYARLVADLSHAVFESSGHVEVSVRQAAAAGQQVPESWRSYVAAVRDHSYRITDGDVAALSAAGRGEEEIFEITVAAAHGAALHRLRAGLRLLDAPA